MIYEVKRLTIIGKKKSGQRSVAIGGAGKVMDHTDKGVGGRRFWHNTKLKGSTIFRIAGFINLLRTISSATFDKIGVSEIGLKCLHNIVSNNLDDLEKWS